VHLRRQENTGHLAGVFRSCSVQYRELGQPGPASRTRTPRRVSDIINLAVGLQAPNAAAA
jgi:hypothetical protein